MNNIVTVDYISRECITTNISYAAVEYKYVVSGYMGENSGYETKKIAEGSFDNIKHLKNNKNIRIEGVFGSKLLTPKNYLKNTNFREPIYSFSILEKIPDLGSNVGEHFTSCISCGFLYSSSLDEYIGKYKNNSRYKIEIAPWRVEDYLRNLSETFLGNEEVTFLVEDKYKGIKKFMYKPYKSIQDEISNIIKLCSKEQKVSRKKLDEFDIFSRKVFTILEECYNRSTNTANYKNYIYNIGVDMYTGPLTYEVFKDIIIKSIPEKYRWNRKSFEGCLSYKELSSAIRNGMWCPDDIEIKKVFDNIIKLIGERVFTVETNDGYLTRFNKKRFKKVVFYRVYSEMVQEHRKSSFDRGYAEYELERLANSFPIPSIEIVLDEAYVDKDISVFNFTLFKLKLSEIIKEEPKFKCIENDIISLLSESLNKLEEAYIPNTRELLNYNKFLSDSIYNCKYSKYYKYGGEYSIAQKYALVDNYELDDITALAKELYGYTLFKIYSNGEIYSLEGCNGLNYLEEKDKIHGALKELC